MSIFCPERWPEEPTPDSLKNCQDCGLYNHGTRMVWGEGNPKAPVLFILDNPGAREDRDGNTTICGTRQTLQKAAYEVGLKKESLFVTYILKRKPVRAYDKELTRLICSQHLEMQLQNHNPSLVLCLENVAVQSFFQNPEIDVKGSRGNWHDVRGYQTAVAYHPLAVRRRPNLYSLFTTDLAFVAKRLQQITCE